MYTELTENFWNTKRCVKLEEMFDRLEYTMRKNGMEVDYEGLLCVLANRAKVHEFSDVLDPLCDTGILDKTALSENTLDELDMWIDYNGCISSI